MDNIHIQTTQNVDIDYQLASLGDRILATLLDYLFFIAYILLYILVASFVRFMGETLPVVFLLVLPILLYDLICETLLQGQSFGKMIMKIKVVKLDGTQAGFGSYLLRWLLRIIDTRLFSGVIAVVTIILNEKGQRLGDIAAGTTVIKMKQKVTLNDTILMRRKDNYVPVFAEVVKLSDTDVAIIREVLRKGIESHNWPIIEKLTAKTKETMGITSTLPHIQFLNTVLQDYTHFGFDK